MANKNKWKLLSDQTESAMWKSVSKKGGSSSADVPTLEGAEYYDAYTGKTLKFKKDPESGKLENMTLAELAQTLAENEKNYDSIRAKIDEIRRQTDLDNYNEQKAKGVEKPVITPASFAVGFKKLSPEEQELYKSSDVMVWGVKRFLKHAVNMHSRETVNTPTVMKSIQDKLKDIGFNEEKHKDILTKQGHKSVLIGIFGKAGAGSNVMDNVAWDNTVVFYNEDMVHAHDKLREELYDKFVKGEITEKEIEDQLSQTALSKTRKIVFDNVCHRKMTTERNGLQYGDVSAFRSGIHRGQIDLGTGAINIPHEHIILNSRVINNSNYAKYKNYSEDDLIKGRIQKEAQFSEVRRITASTSLNDEKFNAEFLKIINKQLADANLEPVEFVRKQEKLDRFVNIIPTVNQVAINTQAAQNLTQNIQSPLSSSPLSDEEKENNDKLAIEAIDSNTVKDITEVSVEEADPILVKAHAILKEKSERLAKELLDTKETADAIQTGIIASVNLKKANIQIENLTNVVAEKENSLAEASKTIEVKNEVIEEKEQEVKAFAAKNSELFDKLTVSDTELAQRDFETKQVAKVFKNPKLISEIKDNNLVTNDDMFAILTGIESKQAGIVRLRKKINEIHKEKRVELKALNEQVSTLEGKITALNRVIKAKDMIVAKKDSVIESLNSTIDGLKDHITNLVEAHTKKLADVKASMKQGYRGFINKLKDNFNNTVIPAKEAQAKADAVKQYENNVLPGKIATVQKAAMQSAIKEYEENNLPEKVAEAIIAYKGTEEYKKEFEQEVKNSVSLKTAELSKKISELEKSQSVNVETLALYVLELRDQIESLKQSPVENEGVDKILDDLQKSLDNDNDNDNENDNNNKPKV